jgi:diguanylate cyclase (GGDEF)-like protein
LLDREQHKLEDVYLWDKNRRWPAERRAMDSGMTGYAIMHEESLRIDDFAEVPPARFTTMLFGDISGEHTNSALVALMRRGGQIIGVLSAQAYPKNAYTAADLDALELLAANAAIAIENARLFAETQRLASTDDLTGVWNRRHFMTLATREWLRVRRYQRPLAIVMLDADHFKQINDTYGHRVGDQVLSALARYCQQRLREVDVVGRYGGEEFVILLPETELAAARDTAERLRAEIAATPIVTDVGPVFLTVSLGVVGRAANDSIELDILLNQADQMLYAAKQSGRNQVVVWNGAH